MTIQQLTASQGVFYWVETGAVIFVIGAVILGFLTVVFRVLTGKPIEGGDGKPLRLPGVETQDDKPTTQTQENGAPSAPSPTPTSKRSNPAPGPAPERPDRTTPNRRIPPRPAAHGTASQSLHSSISRTLPGTIAELDIIDQPGQYWAVNLLITPEKFLQFTSDPTFHGWVHLTHWEAPSVDPNARRRPNYTDDHVYLWYRGHLLGQLEGEDAWRLGYLIRQFEREDHASVYCALHWHIDGEDHTTLEVHINQDRIDEDNNSASVSSHTTPEWAGDHELRR